MRQYTACRNRHVQYFPPESCNQTLRGTVQCISTVYWLGLCMCLSVSHSPFQQAVCLCRCRSCSGRAQHYSVLLTARIDLPLSLFLSGFYELQTLYTYITDCLFNMFYALTDLLFPPLCFSSYHPHHTLSFPHSLSFFL